MRTRTLRLVSLLLIAAAPACGDDDGGTPAADASPGTYTVGGTVSGLYGSVVLQDNGGDDLAIGADGAFTFSTELSDGAAYEVTIASSGAATCTVASASGEVDGADVDTVEVSCIKQILFESTQALNGSGDPSPNVSNNIFSIDEDGTGLRALTDGTVEGVSAGGAHWSPDGTRILFESTRDPDGSDAVNGSGVYNIWVMNADGSDLTALTTGTAADSRQPVWSPDGTRIAFESRLSLEGDDALNTNSASNVWVMNADGSDRTPLTHLTAASTSARFPAWSPDGSTIAFHSSQKLDGTDALNPTSNIWVVGPDGEDLTPLTDGTASGAFSFTPVWSPDGQKIAFHSSRDPSGDDAGNNLVYNVWVVDSDGGGATALTAMTVAGGACNDQVWSPDSQHILFDSARTLDGEDTAMTEVSNVWIMDADGGGLEPLTGHTDAGMYNNGASWSPDGTRIAFESSRLLDGSPEPLAGGTENAWVMDADGGNPEHLTTATEVNASSYNIRWISPR